MNLCVERVYSCVCKVCELVVTSWSAGISSWVHNSWNCEINLLNRLTGIVKVALMSGFGLRLSLGLMIVVVVVDRMTFSCLSWCVYVTVSEALKLTPSIGILRTLG